MGSDYSSTKLFWIEFGSRVHEENRGLQLEKYCGNQATEGAKRCGGSFDISSAERGTAVSMHPCHETIDCQGESHNKQDQEYCHHGLKSPCLKHAEERRVG